MANYLWGFSQDTSATSTTSTKVVSLPALTPAGQSTTTRTIINVVRDFYWTYSKTNEGRQEVPKIILTERRLRTNALINQLKYSIGQVTGNFKDTLANIQKFAQNVDQVSDFTKFITNKLADNSTVQALLPSVTDLAGGAVNFTTTAAGKIANSDTVQQLQKTGAAVLDIATGGNDNNNTVNNSIWLQPYKDLYLTDPTNWIYVLPYFDNNQATQMNSFSDSGNVGAAAQAILGPIAGFATEAADVISSINRPNQITYIERSKFYNYPTEGEDINVEFPLINTGEVTYDDVVRNWQFLFLLVYQNRPGKTSNNTVDQPVIYQVEVPGIKFFPFCYVTSINIEFLGSRREMVINVPSNITTTSNLGDIAGQFLGSSVGSIPITTIIPDAYRIRISLKSMIANSKNFMQHMIGNNNIVETGSAGAVPAVQTTNPVAQAIANNNLIESAAAASPIFAAQNPLAQYGVL